MVVLQRASIDAHDISASRSVINDKTLIDVLPHLSLGECTRDVHTPLDRFYISQIDLFISCDLLRGPIHLAAVQRSICQQQYSLLEWERPQRILLAGHE